MKVNDVSTSLVEFKNVEHRETVYSSIKEQTKNPSRDPIQRQAILNLATHLGWVSGEKPDNTIVEVSFESRERKDMCVKSLQSTEVKELDWLASQL